MYSVSPVNKDVVFDKEARDYLVQGAKLLCDSVSSTMGPRSGNVIVDGIVPFSTHDGVTVAKNIRVSGPEGVGVEWIKQAAGKMNDIAGDGTTTVTVLTYHLLSKAIELVESGQNKMVVRQEMQEAADKVAKVLESNKRRTTKYMLRHIANVSASSEELGGLAYKAGNAVGVDGTVIVEAGTSNEDEIEIVEGVSLQWGLASPFMATDDEKKEARLTSPAVLVVNDTIRSSSEVLPIMQSVIDSGATELAIFCKDMSNEPLNVLVANIVRGAFRAVVIKTPDIEEVAKATNADIYGDEGPSLTAFKGGLGKADLIVATREQTTVLAGAGSEKTAVIRVGGATEIEIEEKKFRIDDAVAAVKAAQEGGILSGGGVALAHAAQTLGGSPVEKMFREALEVPFRTILSNAGIDPELYIEDARQNTGIDITRDLVAVDMIEAGIVDPYKVTSNALSTAVSLACTAVTTGALITELKDEDKIKKES